MRSLVLVVLGTTAGTPCAASAFVVVLCRMHFVLDAGVAVHDVRAACARVRGINGLGVLVLWPLACAACM